MTSPTEGPDDLPGDARLVERALNGSVQAPEAFAVLVRRHEPLVRGLVARFTRGEAEAADLVQDVFLQAFARLSTLRDPARLRPWLASLAVQRALAWGRRRKVERAALPRLARSEVAPVEPIGVAVARGEEQRRVLDALADLPEDTRAVVVLRYLQGLTAPEIAAELDLSHDAVRQRLSRALRTLRERLGEGP